MIKTVVAIERDGYDVRAISILFDVPDSCFDLVAAVKRAATEYCKTCEGRALYEYNCSCFNWADFFDVPNEICEKFGFRRIDGALSDLCVDWDEHLVNDYEFDEE